MTFDNQTFRNQPPHSQSRRYHAVPTPATRRRSGLLLAFGGLLVASLAMPAIAQNVVEIGADGSVKINAGDGTVVQAGAAGTEVRTHGATVEASGQQNLSSRTGNYQTDGDNTQHTQVDVQGDGGVHVISAGGGRATSTVNGRTITSSSSQRGGTTSYANQDLSGRDFAGRQLGGVTFVNSHLAGASFRDAVLVEASFANANLDSVDFRGANLRDATLANAMLSGARFDGATWVDGRICGSGSVGVCR
ncbi:MULTISPECIES: pentapeptide repeat-containing protein [unclassified Lysobacter]